jgi:SET domain-containing protein
MGKNVILSRLETPYMNYNYYKPLPDCLDIRKSNIHGRGLFATERIPAGIILGVTHVEDLRFKDGLIRTELGGYFNHADLPNCEIISFGDIKMLRAIKPIEVDEEITARYTLYTPVNDNSFNKY